MTVLRVALDVPLTRLFDYALPEGTSAEVGDRVVVPFGNRQRVGVVLERAAHSDVPAARLNLYNIPIVFPGVRRHGW